MDKFSGFHYHSTFCKCRTVHLRWIPGILNWPSRVDSRFSRANGGASAWNPAWILEGGAGLWSRIGRPGRFCKLNELNKGFCNTPLLWKLYLSFFSCIKSRGIMIRVLNSKAFLPGKKSKPSFIRNDFCIARRTDTREPKLRYNRYSISGSAFLHWSWKFLHLHNLEARDERLLSKNWYWCLLLCQRLLENGLRYY